MAIDKYRYFTCPICKIRNLDGRLAKECRKKSGLTKFFGAPLPYSNELVKKLIYGFKYQRAKEAALPLSQILIDFLDKNNFPEYVAKHKSRMLLIPIPLYNFRERERGFNQAAELGKRVGEYYQINMLDTALKKCRNTQEQAAIKNKEDRITNVSGAFICTNPELIRGKIVLLIDDVYTSGATMHESAVTLRNAGAAQVWGITLARGS